MDTAFDRWRAQTVTGIVTEILRIKNQKRQTDVIKLFGFMGPVERESLEASCGQWIDRFLTVESFDAEETTLMVAILDAFRRDAAGRSDDVRADINPNDLRALTTLQDWLFPVCIHPAIKATVASQITDRGCLIVQESVTLEVGAELCMKPVDGLQPKFRLDDSGNVVGSSFLQLVEPCIGDPSPQALVDAILMDLADQICISLDEEIESIGVVKYLQGWFASRRSKGNKVPRFFCVINAWGEKAYSESHMKLLKDELASIHTLIPEFVFFELLRGETKSVEEVLLKIISDRLNNIW